MVALGKSLVFYLRYMAAMNRLYYPAEYGSEPDMTTLDDAERVREMAGIVGESASNEAANFLEALGKELETHFNGLKIATLRRKRSRAFAKSYWDWGARVYVSSVRNGWFACGAQLTAPPEVRISLDNGVCGVVVPWLWSQGGRKAADMARTILSGRIDVRAGEGVFDGDNAVALALVPIRPQPPDSFDVDREELLGEVMKVFARIGRKEAQAIAKMVVGLTANGEK